MRYIVAFLKFVIMPRRKIHAHFTEYSDYLIYASRFDFKVPYEYEASYVARCMSINKDCAAIYILSLTAVASGKPFAKQFCELIALICNACADECDRFSNLESANLTAADCRRYALESRKLIFI